MAGKYYDVVIIGAGIAGMTAAIYARRAGKSVLVIESKVHGGQIISTFNIANWPGQPGVSGVDLSNEIYHQMNNLGAVMEYATVTGLRQSEEFLSDNDAEDDVRRLWNVETDDDNYACGAIIVAVGADDKKAGFVGEEKYTGRGVSYCATCDGAFYKDKNVAVIGGGNTALDDALYLADIAAKVYVVHRRNEFRGDKILVAKLAMRENVEFVTPYEPVAVTGEKKVQVLKVEDREGGAPRELAVDGVFVAVGKTPATEFLAGTVDLDERGYVQAGENCHTSAPGVFAAGDCRTKEVRQLVTAAGDGAVAAHEVCQYLN